MHTMFIFHSWNNSGNYEPLCEGNTVVLWGIYKTAQSLHVTDSLRKENDIVPSHGVGGHNDNK